MKKLLALALAIAAVSGGSPVMAGFPQPAPKKTVVVANVTVAKVNVNSSSNANSGLNTINGAFGAKINSGVAVAGTDVLTTVGTNETTITDPCPCEKTVTIGGCFCGPKMTVTPTSKTTVVANVTVAKVTVNSSSNANSGLNTINGGCLSTITTDQAQATTGVVTVVGSNVTTIK
jgi:hypothetical protein